MGLEAWVPATPYWEELGFCIDLQTSEVPLLLRASKIHHFILLALEFLWRVSGVIHHHWWILLVCYCRYYSSTTLHYTHLVTVRIPVIVVTVKDIQLHQALGPRRPPRLHRCHPSGHQSPVTSSGWSFFRADRPLLPVVLAPQN